MYIDRIFSDVAKQKNILLLANADLSNLNDACKEFALAFYENITEHTVDKLSSMLLTNDIDIICVELQENYEIIYKKIEAYSEIKQNLLVITILTGKFYNDVAINFSANIITNNILAERFKQKLLGCLKKLYASENKNSQSPPTMDELEVIEICNGLNYIFKAIDSGDISQALFKRLLIEIQKTQTILGEYLIRSKRIKSIINELYVFMEDFDVENINIDVIDGFAYLARIVEDISVFLKKYFLDREFDDVYIIEDSLQNSIEFMKAKFNKTSCDDNSDLEFFDD